MRGIRSYMDWSNIPDMDSATTGAVFTKGLSQVLGLSWQYFYTKVKPKTWLRPFVNTAPGSNDNPFSGPKASVPLKVTVQMPPEDWLCRKLSKLNLTLVENYPSHCSEAGGLMMDQFLRPAKSQSKWYGLFFEHKADPSTVSTWCTDACKLNSSFSRQSGLNSIPPTLRRISQETLRRWEKSAREATVICNQAASLIHVFSRCSKVCRNN